MSEKIKVRITGCENESFWYSGRIGEVFDVVISNEGNLKVIDKNALGIKFIAKQDCEIISAESIPPETADDVEGIIEGLKPCPFCGEPPIYVGQVHPSGIKGIKCIACNFVIAEDRNDKVIGRWNTRISNYNKQKSNRFSESDMIRLLNFVDDNFVIFTNDRGRYHSRLRSQNGQEKIDFTTSELLSEFLNKEK